MRRYLGITEKNGMYKKIEEYLDKNPNERIKIDNEYQEWLDKNKEILEKSFQKQKIELSDDSDDTITDSIDPKLVEYVKTFGWYKKNEKVNVVLNKLAERISISNQLKNLYSEKIRLTKEPSKIEKELKEIDDEIDLEMKLCSIIRKSGSDFIQDIF